MSYEITDEFIIDGVVRLVKELFPNITIYTEKATQNIKKPCFFVWQLRLNQNKQLQERYQRKYNMVIRYHPSSNITSDYESFNSVENKLCDALNSIICGYVPATSDDPEIPGTIVRGTDISSREESGLLNIFVSYNVNMIRPPIPVEKMHTLELTVST